MPRFALALLLVACNGSVSPPDKGGDVPDPVDDTDETEDTIDTDDTLETDETDDTVDTEDPAAYVDAVCLTSGSADLSTANWSLRVNVGVPISEHDLSSATYDLQLGIGTVTARP